MQNYLVNDVATLDAAVSPKPTAALKIGKHFMSHVPAAPSAALSCGLRCSRPHCLRKGCVHVNLRSLGVYGVHEMVEHIHIDVESTIARFAATLAISLVCTAECPSPLWSRRGEKEQQTHRVFEGGQKGNGALDSICEASLVDITPTLLDILGLLPSFDTALRNRPDEVKGHSLKPAIDRILTKTAQTGSRNVCGSHIPAPFAKTPD